MTKRRVGLILEAVLLLGLIVVSFISAVAGQYDQASYSLSIAILIIVLDDKAPDWRWRP